MFVAEPNRAGMSFVRCSTYGVLVVALVLCNCALLMLHFKEEGLRTNEPRRPSGGTNAASTKVLYCIASASITKRLDVIETILQGCQDWCEAGYSTTIIIDTFEHLPDDISAKLTRRFACPTAPLEIKVVSHEHINVDGSENNLILYHRMHFNEHISKYDIFLFAEDDMMIRLSTIAAWRRATIGLGQLADSTMVGMVGLLRYEDTLPALRDKKIRERVALLAQDAASGVVTHIAAMGSAAEPASNADSRPDTNPTSTKFLSNRVTWELSPDQLRPMSVCTEGAIPSMGKQLTKPLHPPDVPLRGCTEMTRYWEFAQDTSPNSGFQQFTLNPRSNTLRTARGGDDKEAIKSSAAAMGIQNSSVHLPFGAAALYTRQHLQVLERSCQFLSTQTAYKHWARGIVTMQEFYSSQQPYHCGAKETIFGSGIYDFSSPEFYCCMRWMLPVAEFESLFVHHIGTPGLNGDRKWTNRHRIGKAVSVDRWLEVPRN